MQTHRPLLLSLILSIALLSTLLLTLPGGSSNAQADLPIYTDGLADGWANWSWDTTVDFDNSTPVHNGTASLAATYLAGWAGLYLHSGSNIDTSPYDTLRFWIHGGGSGGHQLRVMLADGSNNLLDTSVAVTSQANTWTLVEIPLGDLGDPPVISGLAWQDTSGAAQPVFYLDDIALVNAGLVPTPTPTPASGPTLTVDASAAQHAISPYIYGLNFADAAFAAELQLPFNRWGGNSTTRYSWQHDSSNRASDWYFENIPNPNPHPENLPDGSDSDHFVEQNQSTHTESLLTMPLIGWTPKSRNYDCGFSVSKYGAQESVDPYRTDCGNGKHTDGSNLTGNDPLDTSTAITETYVQAWMAHLTGKYGSADNGGVQFYALDNEPMLWNSTHRDVHPDPVGYDELRDRSYQYAPAIRASDPGAKILGPVLWGWTAYFYSAIDSASGQWGNPPDRNAHGGTPLVEWYLQQMQAYEQQHGTRILDYLDLHFYPQGGQALTTAGDASLQALRLRSTRSLWDPTYTDESWINEPVYLIPRMRGWVDTYYPGTAISLSEYNWGGLEHINGALAQADILGIFGREGLDMATIWDPPASAQPGAFAFRMYRNYDGNDGLFGDVSVSAASSDQERLAIYGAKRSNDGALTLMIVNKSGSGLTSAISLAGYTPVAQAEAYRYSAADLTQIVRLPDQTAGASFSADFPADSITLFVLQSAEGLQYFPSIRASAMNGDDLRLQWLHDTAYSSYHVWRSDEPYFTPPAEDLGVVSAAPWQCIDAQALGAVSTNHFYVVEGVSPGGSSTMSGRVGEFDFALVAGA